MRRQGIAWRQIGTMTLMDLRRTLSGGAGLFFIFVVLLIGWILLTVVTNPLGDLVMEEGVARQSPAAITQQIASFFAPLIKWWVGAPSATDPAVTYLITDQPAVLSLFLIILAAFVPFTSCLVGSDQLATDLASGHTRVLLLRTGRTELMLSRFFSVTSFAALVSFILVAFVALFISLKFQGFPPSVLLVWGLKGWFSLVVISLPFFALTSWLGLHARTTGMVFVMSWLLLTSSIVGLKVLASQLHEPRLERLSPWGWKYDLFHPELGTFLAALGVFFLFTAAFLWLAHARFHRRDC